MTARRFASALLLALCLGASTAAAAGSDADRATARTLGQEGHTALDKKDFATAADRFGRADALFHAPTFLLGLAQAQVGLGKLVSAQEAYNRIVREGVPEKAPPAFAKAVESARQELDALQPRIPYVTLQVAGAAATAAKVTLDGDEVPSAALGVKRPVDPGKHTIRVVADGFLATETSLTLGEGKSETVTLEPKPGPHGPGPAAGPAAGVVVVAPPPPPPPASAGGGRRTIGLAAIGVGGAGLVVGAAMGGVVISKHGSLLQSCPGGHCPIDQQATLQPQLNQYHTFADVSTAGFIAGGVLAAAGIVLVTTAPRPGPAVGRGGAPGQPRATLEAMIGPSWAGVGGSFQ